MPTRKFIPRTQWEKKIRAKNISNSKCACSFGDFNAMLTLFLRLWLSTWLKTLLSLYFFILWHQCPMSRKWRINDIKKPSIMKVDINLLENVKQAWKSVHFFRLKLFITTIPPKARKLTHGWIFYKYIFVVCCTGDYSISSKKSCYCHMELNSQMQE